MYNFPEEAAKLEIPELMLELTTVRDQGAATSFVHLQQRFQKIHAIVASFKLADVWVAPLREMAGKLRSTWLQVLKKSFQAYRANAVAHLLDYV